MTLKRVFWTEGMVLMPQHFQHLEAYHHNSNFVNLKAQGHFSFGFSELKFDDEKLHQGYFSITLAEGILPDGTPFSCPAESGLPPITELPKSSVNNVLYLCVGSRGAQSQHSPRAEASLTDYEGEVKNALSPRYRVEELTVDAHGDDGADKVSIDVASLYFRVVQQQQLTPHDVALPLALVKNIGEKGEIELSEDFIPPLLDVHANKGLSRELNQLLALIDHRITWQMKRLNQPQSSSLLETSDFLLLQSLMRNEACLRFELGLSPATPLQIYRQLLSLSTELGAVQHPPVRMQSPTGWDGTDLSQYFPPILQGLRDMLSNMRERLALELNLRTSSDGIYVSDKALPAIGAGDRIVIAVQAKVPEDWFWSRFNGQVIVSASDRLSDRVRLQMKGVDLKHLSTTPPELPLQMGWHYFELLRDNEPWQEIAQTRSMSLHIAGHWPGFSIRTWVLQSSPSRRTQV